MGDSGGRRHYPCQMANSSGSDAPTTAELARRLRNLGYRTTAAQLRQDVLHNLVSPAMPEDRRPGRGRLALWSPAAVRRCLYVARLRKAGADGRIIPLLSFLRDGWGWAHIRGAVINAATKAVEVDRRQVARMGRFTEPRGLMELVDTGQHDGPLDWKTEILPVRQYLATASQFGKAAENTSTVHGMAALFDSLGISTSQGQREKARELEDRRRESGLPAEQLPQWLSHAEDPLAQLGRAVFLQQGADFRKFARAHKLPNSNPLMLLCGSKSELREMLRSQTGRLTPAQFLAAWIGQCIFAAALLDAPLREGSEINLGARNSGRDKR
jgi:hypothetical protein